MRIRTIASAVTVCAALATPGVSQAAGGWPDDSGDNPPPSIPTTPPPPGSNDLAAVLAQLALILQSQQAPAMPGTSTSSAQVIVLPASSSNSPSQPSGDTTTLPGTSSATAKPMLSMSLLGPQSLQIGKAAWYTIVVTNFSQTATTVQLALGKQVKLSDSSIGMLKSPQRWVLASTTKFIRFQLVGMSEGRVSVIAVGKTDGAAEIPSNPVLVAVK